MAVENSRKQNRTVSAGTQTDKAFNHRPVQGIPTRVVKWLAQLVMELLGAIEDHRKWINSDRAHTLGTSFEISGRLFTYAVYIALAWLAYKSVLGIRGGLLAGVYTIPEQNTDGPRVALFNIMATGLFGPIIIIALGIGIGWVYNLTSAAANRTLPRFARPLVYPSILFVVAVAFSAFHSVITEKAAKGYLIARANIEAASPKESEPVRVVEIPVREMPDEPQATGHDPSSDRELVRLRSIFNRARPCASETQGAPLNPQSEVQRPEPGQVSNIDCQTEKPATPE